MRQSQALYAPKSGVCIQKDRRRLGLATRENLRFYVASAANIFDSDQLDDLQYCLARAFQLAQTESDQFSASSLYTAYWSKILFVAISTSNLCTSVTWA